MRRITCSIVILIALFSTISHSSGSTEFDDLLISAIEIQGLQRVNEQLVLNNIRTTVGTPYNQTVVQDDVRRLNRLGRFKSIESKTEDFFSFELTSVFVGVDDFSTLGSSTFTIFVIR